MSNTSDSSSTDFTIATLFDSSEQIRSIAAILRSLDSPYCSVSRRKLNERLPAEHSLSLVDAEALFVGLVLNGAAERAARDGDFAHATFEIDTSRAQTILYEQVVALKAFNSRDHSSTEQSNVEFIATVPPQLELRLPDSVADLNTRVRSAMLSADRIVRIANPYFDPEHPTVETLRTLPKRGVETRVLTRSMENGTDRFRVLSRMVSALDPSERDLVDIAELYKLDETGKQAYATHAKLVVVDDTQCYLGSANFTRTNLSTNFEVGIITTGPEVATASDTFDAIFKASRSVSF